MTVKGGVVMPLPSLTNIDLPPLSTPTAMQILLRDRPRGSLPSGRCHSLPATSDTYVSSIQTVPESTASSWMPSSTANSFAIQ